MKDNTTPGDKWEFDAEVAACFDDMLARSIPQYFEMRGYVTDLANQFCIPDTLLIDIGCSRGGALAPILEGAGQFSGFVGLEVSEPMLECARVRFADSERVSIVDHDIRLGLPEGGPASVVLSILTLQFIPINYRQKILRDAFSRIEPGGVFILVEKVLGHGALVDNALVDLYHDMKSRHGYSREGIDRKRASLEGVLVPVTASWNEDLLRSAGFCEVDCFWRALNFAGWVAIKGAV